MAAAKIAHGAQLKNGRGFKTQRQRLSTALQLHLLRIAVAAAQLDRPQKTMVCPTELPGVAAFGEFPRTTMEIFRSARFWPHRDAVRALTRRKFKDRLNLLPRVRVSRNTHAGALGRLDTTFYRIYASPRQEAYQGDE